MGLLWLEVMTLEEAGDHLPSWLYRLSEGSGLVWTIGLGLIITQSALRWLLGR
jgi:hypothetical protein